MTDHPCEDCTHLTRGVVIDGAIRGWFCPLDCRKWREDQQRSRERRAREDRDD